MKYIFTYLLLFVTLTCNTLLANETTKEPTQETQAKYIAVSDIPQQSSDTLQELNEIEKELTLSQEIKDLHLSLKSYIRSLHETIDNPVYDYLLDLNVKELKKLQSGLVVHKEQLAKSSELLTQYIDKYDKKRLRLIELSNLWAQTHINATSKNAPETIKSLIASVIIKIEEVRSTQKAQYDLMLIDNTTLTNTLLSIEEKNDALKSAISDLSSRYFTRDASWIFSDFDIEYFLPFEYIKVILTNVSTNINNVVIYYKTHLSGLFLLIFINFLLALFIYYFHRLYIKRTLFVKKTSFQKKNLFFLRRPISTFVLLALLSNVVVFPDRPHLIIQITSFILIYPIIRIFSIMLHQSLHRYLYQFFTIFTINLLLENAEGYDLTHRIASLLITISFMYVAFTFIKFIKTRYFTIVQNKVILYVLSYSIFFWFILSCISNLAGYTLLSEAITNNTSMLITMTILIYLITLILQGYILLIFRRRVTEIPKRLRDFSNKMEYSILFFIRLFMFSWWMYFFFKVLNLNDDVTYYKDAFLDLSWSIGAMKLSVSSVVRFIIIILLTWFSARTLQIVLTFFVFARIQFSRGIATAISSISNYMVIIMGTLMALASLGISTEQFALIFGALGVGVGFGLRNIIANFVSGIIMIFERPVQIGDTISVDAMMGDVTKIGSRSSTIRTFDGSEVIIPNADFISQKIINWTFSDKDRRKTFLIKVAIGTNVQTVIDIMMQIAENHPDVLKEPQPIPTLLNVGEYYLEFKLYFWLRDNLIVAQSDIAIGIYEALLEAGVQMPASKQEMLVNNTIHTSVTNL